MYLSYHLKIHNTVMVFIKEMWVTWERKGNHTGMEELKKGQG